MRRAGQVAAVVLVGALIAVEPPSASAATLAGRVVGEPHAAKKGTAVRVLLNARSARRARLDSRIGVLHVTAKTVKGPRRKRIATRLLRVNDLLRARAKVGRRARRSAYWRIRIRAVRITKRASVLSAAELQHLVDALRDDVSKLSATLMDLARYTAAGFASLRADLAALRADLTALRSEFTALAARFAATEARLAALAGDLAALDRELQGLRDDVAALNAAVASLSAQLATLQGEVATLTSDLAALSATVGALSGQLGDLSTLGGTVEELLAGVAPGDVAGALADIGTLQTELAGLAQQVNGLQSDVDALCGPGSLLDTLC